MQTTDNKFRSQAESDPDIIRLHGPAGGAIAQDPGWRGALRERAVSALAYHLEAETWRPVTSTAQTPCPGCGAWKDFHADGEHDGNCPA